MEPFPFLAHLEILPEWEEAGARFLAVGGAVMVLGGADTGKSTLCRYLVYRAFAAGQPAALVDLDLGQSHLGPPACLGLGLFPPRRPGDDALFPDGLYFIGQTSPLGAGLEVAVGCRVLADLARARGVARVVVNTSGYVQGPGALRLKRAEMELLNPPLMLALQHDRELEPMLRGLVPGTPRISSPPQTAPTSHLAEAENRKPKTENRQLLRLPISSRIVPRSPEERRRYREERFRRYFQGARRLELPCRSLAYQGLPWGRGEPLAAADLGRWAEKLGTPVLYGEVQDGQVALLTAMSPPSPLETSKQESIHCLSRSTLAFRLVGLLDGALRTLALGLILPDSWERGNLALWTPLPPSQAETVRLLKVGKLRLSLKGQELSHV